MKGNKLLTPHFHFNQKRKLSTVVRVSQHFPQVPMIDKDYKNTHLSNYCPAKIDLDTNEEYLKVLKTYSHRRHLHVPVAAWWVWGLSPAAWHACSRWRGECKRWLRSPLHWASPTGERAPVCYSRMGPWTPWTVHSFGGDSLGTKNNHKSSCNFNFKVNVKKAWWKHTKTL